MTIVVDFCIVCELKQIPDGSAAATFVIVGMLDDAKGVIKNLCNSHKNSLDLIYAKHASEMRKLGF